MLEGESVCSVGVMTLKLVILGFWEWEWDNDGFCLSSSCERPSCSANTCSVSPNTRSAYEQSDKKVQHKA